MTYVTVRVTVLGHIGPVVTVGGRYVKVRRAHMFPILVAIPHKREFVAVVHAALDHTLQRVQREKRVPRDREIEYRERENKIHLINQENITMVP